MKTRRPDIARDAGACRAVCLGMRAEGRRIAFVPTMGALHRGHARLLTEGRERGDYLVASIFVNPTQFGEGEDLERYPRDLDGDLATCAAAGVDLVFAPDDPADIYPEGFQTWVEVGEVTRHFCGASRPGHFRGVATVVAKLFNIVGPDVALFGEKDFQQLVTLRRMSRDLNLGVEVIGVPTVREADGLALSSRNAYLDKAARTRALALHRAIRVVQRAFADGERRVGNLRRRARHEVAAAVDRVDYVDLAHPDKLVPLPEYAEATGETRLLLAAWVDSVGGKRTRLIDNAAVGG